MPGDISTKYHHTPNWKGLTISTTSYSHHQFPKHFHNHYTIQWIEKGVNEGFTESDQYKVGPGNLLIINPGELHAGKSWKNDKLKFHTLRLEHSFIKTWLEQNEIFQSTEIYFDRRPIYGQSFTKLAGQLLSDVKAGQFLSAESYLHELLMALTQKQSLATTTDKRDNKASLNLAREYMHDHFRLELTLKEIAQACHLSPYHFSRQFKKQFGLTPFQYLRNIRIEKAKNLLSTYSISQVAHRVGFYDHSHFLKNFKKIEGIKPSNLRAG